MNTDQIIHLLVLSLLISLVSWGVHLATRHGMLLNWIDRMYSDLTGRFAWWVFPSEKYSTTHQKWPGKNTWRMSAANDKCFEITLRLFYQLSKPLFRCPTCMASVWSLIGWILFVGRLHWHLLVCMLCVCGINGLLVLITNQQNNESDTAN